MSENVKTVAVTEDVTDTGTPRHNKRPRMSPDPEPQQQQQQLQEQELHKVMTSYTYAWSIPRLDGPCCQMGEYIDSPPFTVCDTNDSNREYTCFLRFYGNGFDADTKSYISIRVYLVDKIDNNSKYTMGFQCKISMLYKQDYVETNSQYAIRLNLENKQNCIYTFRKFIYRNKLDFYLQNNYETILLCCVGIAKYRRKIVFDVARYQSCMEISNDVAFYSSNAILSDLMIIAEGRKFPVHRMIILKRSSTFYWKLYHKIKHDVVVIEDIEIAVLSRILEFMYKGTVSDSPSDITEKLLVASTEYIMHGLKDLCQVNLCERVNVNNAIDLLLLAEKHYAYILKETVIDFIVNNATEIIESNGFKFLGKSHHKLVKEIFCKLAIKSKCQ